MPRTVQESIGIIFIQNCLVGYLCVFCNLTAKASFVCVFIPVSFIHCDFTRPASGKPSVGENELRNASLVPALESRLTVFVKFWMCVLLAGPGVRSAPRGPSRHVIWPPYLSFIRGRSGVFKQNSWPGRPTRVGRDSFLPALPH